MFAIKPDCSQLPFNGKIEFSTSLFKKSKIKEVSETAIEFGPDADTTGKVIALKAPIVKIQALLSASKKLVIHTDVLIINGGYITEPKKWDIQAKEVRLINVSEDSQWICKLIEESGGAKSISSSNFNSQQDVDCNFDIPAKPPLENKVIEIANEIKDFKNKILNWR